MIFNTFLDVSRQEKFKKYKIMIKLFKKITKNKKILNIKTTTKTLKKYRPNLALVI